MIAEEFEGFSIDDIRAAERDIIMRTLRNNDRNYKVVAAKLHVSTRTLRRKIKEYGL